MALLFSTCRIAHGQSPQTDQQAQPPQQAEPAQPDAQPSLMTPLKPQPASAPYQPITRRERVRWVLTNSIGPAHLIGGIFSAGFGTALDRPEEDGTHWAGFGERFGMRLTSIVPGNIMEAGIGEFWGEDPRYFRVPDIFSAPSRWIVRARLRALYRHSRQQFPLKRVAA
jgi:hypothetical protein